MIEVITIKPTPVKHKIINIHKSSKGEEMVELEVANGTIEFPQIYIPKDAFADRRKFYDMPKATDDEIREKIIEEHKLRIIGEL